MAKTFKLPYYISNNGDGSASVHLCESVEQAEEKDASQNEGWGESSASSVNIKVDDDGKVFFETWATVAGKFQKIWVEVKE